MNRKGLLMPAHPWHVAIQVGIPHAMVTTGTEAGGGGMQRIEMRRDKVSVTIERQREHLVPPRLRITGCLPRRHRRATLSGTNAAIGFRHALDPFGKGRVPGQIPFLARVIPQIVERRRLIGDVEDKFPAVFVDGMSHAVAAHRAFLRGIVEPLGDSRDVLFTALLGLGIAIVHCVVALPRVHHQVSTHGGGIFIAAEQDGRKADRIATLVHRNRNTCQIQGGGHDVVSANQLMAGPSGGDPARPAKQEGHPVTSLKDMPFLPAQTAHRVMPEALLQWNAAIVAGEADQRVIQQAALLQHFHQDSE